MLVFIKLLFLLLIGHAFADFALQTGAIAWGKRRSNISRHLYKGKVMCKWPYYLTAHALIHAGCVYYITCSLLFAFIELVSHWLIDFCSCEQKINVHEDQFFHVALKIVYAVALAWAAL